MTQLENGALDPATALKCDLAGEVLSSFGNLRFAATGWSMLPSVWPGDMLMVDRAGRDQVRVGDVVLTKRDGRFCAHRVVAISRDAGDPRWITQGDGMSAPDGLVSEKELLGRVRYVIRGGKCVEVPTKLSLGDRVIVAVVRRSIFAARVLVKLHQMRQGWSEGDAAFDRCPGSAAPPKTSWKTIRA